MLSEYTGVFFAKSDGRAGAEQSFDGMQYAIKNAVMMVTMTERDDIDVTMSNNATIPDEFREERCPLHL